MNKGKLMPLNKGEWKIIDEKIEAAIKQSQPRGWKKALHVMREWGVLAVNISVILGLVALAATQFYQANARLAKEAAFEATTDQSLKGIQGDIGGIKTDVAKLNLALSAAKPIAQFKASLPELRSSIAAAQKQNAKMSPALMADLQSKLMSVCTDVPSYWPVVADFITYRSYRSASWSPPANLPNCRDTQPSTTTLQNNFQMNGKPQKLETKLVGYHDCRFALDSTLDGNWLNTLIDKAAVFFKTCVILYSGGPIVARLDLARQTRVVDSVVEGTHGMTVSISDSLQFEDCVFEFTVQPSPNQQAKTLTELLLNQSAPTIKLPIQKLS